MIVKDDCQRRVSIMTWWAVQNDCMLSHLVLELKTKDYLTYFIGEGTPQKFKIVKHSLYLTKLI